MNRKTYKSRRKSFTLCSYLIFAVLFFSSTVIAKSSLLPHPHGSTEAKSSQEPDPKLQELREKLNHFAEAIRFQYDSTVLPTASIRALDQIIQIMREYDGAYQYNIRVHSYESGQTDTDALVYSKNRGNAIRMYLINQGISSKNLLVQGLVSSYRRCFDETEADCYTNNNRLEIDIRKRDQEDDNGEFSEELTRLASRVQFNLHGALFPENNDIVKEMADNMQKLQK
ncbi:OmpA family protein [Sphingobacterium sp. FBM7-1]|uniref:OmpA family protein n=1 Tax=Sphingobacterium sp. FBM7-1 TaxID=2886688 RepID=UPI001D0FAF6C|nr:OmpA family protein [Sphingobacterium sp. FBM7-1]MCC2599663.1 OmpA family protein [Sphingobacterium sp. FBM7-1]